MLITRFDQVKYPKVSEIKVVKVRRLSLGVEYLKYLPPVPVPQSSGSDLGQHFHITKQCWSDVAIYIFKTFKVGLHADSWHFCYSTEAGGRLLPSTVRYGYRCTTARSLISDEAGPLDQRLSAAVKQLTNNDTGIAPS